MRIIKGQKGTRKKYVLDGIAGFFVIPKTLTTHRRIRFPDEKDPGTRRINNVQKTSS